MLHLFHSFVFDLPIGIPPFHPSQCVTKHCRQYTPIGVNLIWDTLCPETIRQNGQLVSWLSDSNSQCSDLLVKVWLQFECMPELPGPNNPPSTHTVEAIFSPSASFYPFPLHANVQLSA